MFFYSKLNDDPNLFTDLVNKDNVKRLAKIIGEEKNEYVCSRISFELYLGGHDNFSGQAPMILDICDVLEEIMRIKARKTDLEKKLNKKWDPRSKLRGIEPIGHPLKKRRLYGTAASCGELTKERLKV